MPEVRIGRGGLQQDGNYMDTVQIIGTGQCRPDACPFTDGKYQCHQLRGSSTIEVTGGIDRETTSFVWDHAPCVQG